MFIFGIITLFTIAFFPAYLGYQEQYAWVGYVFTIIFALSSYIPFITVYRWRGVYALCLLILFGYLIESVGIMTCFPYGCFSYSSQLGMKLFGIVPVMLAFTRPPLVLWVWYYIHERVRSRWQRRCVWWLALVFVDLILDPLTVWMGLWNYPWGGEWFGVPWTNFAWWMLSGTIAMIILDSLLREKYTYSNYSYGLWCTMTFFIGYGVWKRIL